MEYIGDVVYDYAGGLYINMTNRCPCRCEFCIRDLVDSLGGADSLWLKREPSLEEILEELERWEFWKYDEVVFCGYGEPMVRLPELLEICRYVKAKTNMRCRVNTNGLGDLIHGEDTACRLEGLVDAVSVSLNAADAEKYNDLCHPAFGEKAYDGLLKFTENVKAYVADVTMSVVGGTIPAEDVETCRATAEKLGVKFRVR